MRGQACTFVLCQAPERGGAGCCMKMSAEPALGLTCQPLLELAVMTLVRGRYVRL